MNFKSLINQITIVLLCLQLFNVGIYQQVWVQYFAQHECRQDPIEDVIELIAENIFLIKDFDHHRYNSCDGDERGYQLVEIVDILELYHADLHESLVPPAPQEQIVFNYHSFTEDAKSHIQAVVPPPPEC